MATVNATVTVYQSTDASAPTLTGEAGSLIALLDACLVDGYGAQAGAGWTQEYSASNVASFRPGAGPQHYLQVIDDAGTWNVGAATGQPTVSNPERFAFLRGYETMTSETSGALPLPDASATVSNFDCISVMKSTSSDSTARPWCLLATDRTFYLFHKQNNPTTDPPAQYDWFTGFGAFNSSSAVYAWNTFLIGSYQKAGTTVNAYNSNLKGLYFGTAGTTGMGCVIRDSASTANTGVYYLMSDASASNYLGSNRKVFNYPEPLTSGVALKPCYLVDNADDTQVWGQLPGLYDHYHLEADLTHLDEVTHDSVDYLTMKCIYVYSTATWAFFQIGTWAYNE